MPGAKRSGASVADGKRRASLEPISGPRGGIWLHGSLTKQRRSPMLDPVHSLPTARAALAPSPTEPRADEAPEPEGSAQLSVNHERRYSIRVTESPGALCVACGSHDTGAGPVGFLDEEPICDLCLLEASPDLGLLLGVAAVNRAYAQGSGSPAEQQEALEELGACARIYHGVASRSWPLRIFRIPGSTVPGRTTN